MKIGICLKWKYDKSNISRATMFSWMDYSDTISSVNELSSLKKILAKDPSGSACKEKINGSCIDLALNRSIYYLALTY